MAVGMDEQSWLDRRFDGLEIEDFDGVLLFCSTANFQPPAAFKNFWRHIPPDEPTRAFTSLGPEIDMSKLKAILIFCNQAKEEEVGRLGDILAGVDSCGQEAPPILWVLHSVAPEKWPSRRAAYVPAQLLENLLHSGLDGAVEGEPEGLRLAMQVRAKINECGSTVQTLREMIEEAEGRARYQKFIEHATHESLWTYVRERLAPEIPPVDGGIPAGQPQQLPGFTLGRRLGSGAFGSVFMLKEVPDRGNAAQAAKVLQKVTMTQVDDIRCLGRTLHVMAFLSSDEVRHRGLVALHEAYHTPTHVVLRMENAGPESLFRRLSRRQSAKADQQRPLALDRVVSIVGQLVDVVAHLHAARVAHRDIKPENTVLNETPTSISVKLADYDLSIICKSQAFCREPCGTLPFSAPEVLLSSRYDAICADVWSLGVVLLEVLCGVRVLEQAVDALEARPAEESDPLEDEAGRPRRAAESIRSFFQAPGSTVNLLEARIRAELRPLLQICKPLLAAMLEVDPGLRMEADEARSLVTQGLATLSASAPSAPPPSRRRPAGNVYRL